MIASLFRLRYLSFGLTVVILVALLVGGQKVTYEQSIRSFFAEDDPDLLDYQRAADRFGNDNFVFVVYDDPEYLSATGIERLGRLVEGIGPDQINGVVRVESLDQMPVLWELDDQLLRLVRLPAFLREGFITVLEQGIRSIDPSTTPLVLGPAIRQADEAGQADRLETLRERITAHPLLARNLVSESGTTASVMVRLGDSEEYDIKSIITALRERSDQFAQDEGLERVAIVGPPVLLADGFLAIERDGRRLSILGMTLIGLVMLVAVRSLWWAIIPILAGWTVWLGTEHIMAVLGMKLSLSGGPLVAQIIVLTMPAASHLAIHYRDDLRTMRSRQHAGLETMRQVSVPIFWCAVTTALGYYALLTSNLVPIRQFGGILGSCTFLTALVVMATTPLAMLPPVPLEWPVRYGSRSPLARPISSLLMTVNRRAGWIVGTLVVVAVPISLGSLTLQYETNYVNIYQNDTRVVDDYRYVEERLGGIGVFETVMPMEDGLDMAALQDLAVWEQTVEETGQVAHQISLNTVLDPDGRIAELDPEQAALALETKLRLIQASPQAELLGNFWEPDSQQSRVLTRIREQQPNRDKQAIFQLCRATASDLFGAQSYLTGLSYLMTKTSRSVVVTQWTTLLLALGSIMLMLVLALRRPRLAGLAIFPTILAVGFVLGLMGWMGIKLDIATALVASIALDLSVDDTFHCLLQYRRLRDGGRSHVESLLESYAVTGPGVLLSSLAVAVGFAQLWVSEFVPFANFGAMVAIATVGSTLGNIFLLPACLSLFDRLDPKGSRAQASNESPQPVYQSAE